MRVSREQAGRNREAVVDAAAELFRARGFEGVGIAEVMQATGLTHGGFYKQFASKAELMVEAADRAMAENRANLARRGGADGRMDLPRIAAGYLSERHRDDAGKGCTFAALAAEAARGGPALKAAFGRGLRAQRDLLRHAVEGADDAARARQTLLVLSTMVGALLLARAVDDVALSDEILAAASAAVGQMAARAPLDRDDVGMPGGVGKRGKRRGPAGGRHGRA